MARTRLSKTKEKPDFHSVCVGGRLESIILSGATKGASSVLVYMCLCKLPERQQRTPGKEATDSAALILHSLLL